MTVIDPYAGTAETSWAEWLARQRWPDLDREWLGQTTVHVLAAHPDDETLAVGGLLASLASAAADVRLVWATDGEASHVGSTAAAVEHLARLRRAEAAAAMVRLGLSDARRTFLGLPDGCLADHEDDLTALLAQRVRPGDVVLAPWSGDGHPDHEACGRAALRVPTARVLEYPVWAWSWSQPGDARVPWHRVRRVPLAAAHQERKGAAVAEFRSQVVALGPEPADGPVLPARVLAYFRRDVEVVLA